MSSSSTVREIDLEGDKKTEYSLRKTTIEATSSSFNSHDNPLYEKEVQSSSTFCNNNEQPLKGSERSLSDNRVNQLTHHQQSESTSFLIKKVVARDGHEYSYLLQNENGPCPLLAIINLLNLRDVSNIVGKEFLDQGFITTKDLIQVLSNLILDSAATAAANNNSLSPTVDPNCQNIEVIANEALNTLPTLSDGLNVNCRFCDARTFEYTPELSIFDLLNIPLYHGWVADAQECPILHHLSYNQAVDLIARHSELSSLVLEVVDLAIACQSENSSSKQPDAVSTQMAQEHVTLLCPPRNALRDDNQNATHFMITKSQNNDDIKEKIKSEIRRECTKHELNEMLSEEVIQLVIEEAMVKIEKEDYVVPSMQKCHQSELMNNFLKCVSRLIEITKIVTEANAIQKADNNTSIKNPSTLYEFLNNGCSIRRFLNQTANQLTYEGLIQLLNSVPDKHLAILFRNDHFSVLCHHENRLYELQTDVGFKDETSIVWASLDNPYGNSHFFDINFCPLGRQQPKTELDNSRPKNQESDRQKLNKNQQKKKLNKFLQKCHVM